jgi:hypothetical protein
MKPGRLRRAVEEQVIGRFIECGDLHHGLARIYCNACGHDYLLAYSCKKKGTFLSCGKGTLQLCANTAREYIDTLLRLAQHLRATACGLAFACGHIEYPERRGQ